MASPTRLRALFIIPSGDFLPSGIVRVRQFLPFLDRSGIVHTVVSYYSPRVDRFTATVRTRQWPAVLQRAIIMATMGVQSLFRWWARLRVLVAAPWVDVVFFQGVLPPVWYVKVLKRMNARVVLDLDDAIFLGNPQRGAAVVPLMWQVIAGSHFIFEYAKSLGARVALVPSAVSLDRYRDVPANESASSQVVRIGWLGSQSTVRYLEQLVEPLRALSGQGHQIELLIAGVSADAGLLPAFPGVTVTCTSTYRDEDIPSIVGRYDIGVMPLDDGPWERAKCAMKALIYMAGGKPAVCSRVGENRYVIEDGRNGFLADSAAEWTTKLGQLMADASLRAEMGRRGRLTVEARYSAQVCFGLLMEHVFLRAGANFGSAGTAN